MAVDQGEAEDGEQQQVGDGAREVESGEDAHLDHQGDDTRVVESSIRLKRMGVQLSLLLLFAVRRPSPGRPRTG